MKEIDTYTGAINYAVSVCVSHNNIPNIRTRSTKTDFHPDKKVIDGFVKPPKQKVP